MNFWRGGEGSKIFGEASQSRFSWLWKILTYIVPIFVESFFLQTIIPVLGCGRFYIIIVIRNGRFHALEPRFPVSSSDAFLSFSNLSYIKHSHWKRSFQALEPCFPVSSSHHCFSFSEWYCQKKWSFPYLKTHFPISRSTLT